MRTADLQIRRTTFKEQKIRVSAVNFKITALLHHFDF
jgi:hypothetical protein